MALTCNTQDFVYFLACKNIRHTKIKSIAKTSQLIKNEKQIDVIKIVYENFEWKTFFDFIYGVILLTSYKVPNIFTFNLVSLQERSLRFS